MTVVILKMTDWYVSENVKVREMECRETGEVT